MLLDKEVEITLNNRTIPYFESLGYEIPKYKDKDYRWKVKKGTKITVKVEHLNEGNKVEVRIQCDYCNKVFTKKYQDYVAQKKKSLIKLDSCIDCRKHKINEVCREKYGVDSIFQTEKMRKILSDKNKLDCDFIRIQFLEKNMIPIFKNQDYKDCNSRLGYLCPNHPDVVQWTTVASLIHNNNRGCRMCAFDRRRGELNHNWKGGLTSLNVFLRDSIAGWVRASIKNCNYRCVITGKPYEEVHHLYSFHLIVQEALDELGVQLKGSISDYSDEELESIKEKVIEIHYRYPLGVCLTKEVHDLFHSIYGRSNNTPEQFEEFKKLYKERSA